MSQQLCMAAALGLGYAALVGCGPHDRSAPPSAPATQAHPWIRIPAPTTDDLKAIYCSPDGVVYAFDVRDGRYDLCGRSTRRPAADVPLVVRDGDRVYRAGHGPLECSTDGGKTWRETARELPSGRVSYGYVSVLQIFIVPGTNRVFAFCDYGAVSNSLEDRYRFLLRSDDAGQSWSQIWTGTNSGPRGAGIAAGIDLGEKLAMLPNGTLIATGATAGSVLVSIDGAETFIARPLPMRVQLTDLWIDPRGPLVGIGDRGTVVTSSDAGKSFAVEPTGVTADLRAMVGCRGSLWVVGNDGTVLRRRDRSAALDLCR